MAILTSDALTKHCRDCGIRCRSRSLQNTRPDVGALLPVRGHSAMHQVQLRLVIISLKGEAVSRDSADDDDDCDEDGDEYFLPRHVGSEMGKKSLIDDLLVLKLVSLEVVDEVEKNEKKIFKVPTWRCLSFHLTRYDVYHPGKEISTVIRDEILKLRQTLAQHMQMKSLGRDS